MIFPKNVLLWSLCLVVATGCAAPKKEVVPTQPRPLTESQTVSKMPPSAEMQEEEDEGVYRPRPLPMTMEEQMETGEEDIDFSQVQGPLPSMSYVNDRIFEYGRKLERWREIDAQSAGVELTQKDSETMVDCFVDLQKVLDGYNQLRADMLRLNTGEAAFVISGQEIMDLQKRDISFLESECGQLFAAESDELIDWASREEAADLPQLETLIERYTKSQEYEEVIKVWRNIPQQQRERVHLRTRILYGNALMFLRQEKEAAKMYQQIVDEMSASEQQKTDLLSLRKVLADLYTASKDYAAAEEQYMKISRDYRSLGSIEEWSELQLNILERSVEEGPELTKYSNLLRNFLGFLPSRDGFTIVWEAEKFLEDYPYSAVASNVDLIKAEAQRRAQEWFDGFFADVNRLAGEKKYLDAIKKLETIPTDLISEGQKQQVKEKNEELVLAEAVEREMRKVKKMKELQKLWNDGMIKVEEGDYEAAIAIFESLLQTEYYAKAKNKIEEITLLAAKTARREAADLYVRYTKTSDVEMKKKLLTESRRLLKEILEKYPDVGITEKVKGNIERVEQEMNALDPNLLMEVEAAEKSEPESATAEEEPDEFAFSPIIDTAPTDENGLEEEDLTQ